MKLRPIAPSRAGKSLNKKKKRKIKVGGFMMRGICLHVILRMQGNGMEGEFKLQKRGGEMSHIDYDMLVNIGMHHDCLIESRVW